MKAGVITFPGSNCDHDMVFALGTQLGIETRELWHKDVLPADFKAGDWVVLPGGFSFGDYLRCGAIARFSNIMPSIIDFVKMGGNVLGVCNGFQILCEAELLPGVLLRNKHQKFICKDVYIKTTSTNSVLTRNLAEGEVLRIPIAHAEGRYYAPQDELDQLIANDQVLFRYCNEAGIVNTEFNPNGAVNNIAGICNKERNVFGMMPHPERAVDPLLGNNDGMRILSALTHAMASV